jgi:tRNA-dihydrouridine synthase 3
MGDQQNATDPEGGLKRHLESEQLLNTGTEQPSTEAPSAATNGAQIEVENVKEPASKRVKLEQAKEEPKIDARDKVKGIAMIKPEYICPFLRQICTR